MSRTSTRMPRSLGFRFPTPTVRQLSSRTNCCFLMSLTCPTSAGKCNRR